MVLFWRVFQIVEGRPAILVEQVETMAGTLFEVFGNGGGFVDSLFERIGHGGEVVQKWVLAAMAVLVLPQNPKKAWCGVAIGFWEWRKMASIGPHRW